ncbi:MAG: MobA/MobL family protein, partial [Anaerolineae bacterium]|nr:MobA/MobL family protein [Anaerolineae bacterium]
MGEAHFHLHAATVSRARGDSAQGAAAYQSNQCLIHVGQRLCTVAIDHRKGLNKGIISDELRRELEAKELFRLEDPEGLALLEAGTAPIAQLRLLEKANQKRPVIRQEALPANLKFWQTLLRHFEKAGEALSDRLRLWESQDGFTLRDKDHQQSYHLKMDNGQMVVSRYHGIVLSNQATSQKDKRRYWTISDGDQRYLVHQYEETAYDKATKKQTIIGRHLDIYGDKAHDYRGKGDVVETWVRDPEHAPALVKALGSERAAHQGAITEAERQALWQMAEDLEPARNGRPARKIEVALLRELTYEQNKQALNRFIETHLTGKGLIC